MKELFFSVILPQLIFSWEADFETAYNIFWRLSLESMYIEGKEASTSFEKLNWKKNGFLGS